MAMRDVPTLFEQLGLQMKRRVRALSAIQQMLKTKREIAAKKERKEAMRVKLELVVDNARR